MSMETSAKPHFSTIARALLLNTADVEAQRTVKVEIEENDSKDGLKSDGVNGQCQSASTSGAVSKSDNANGQCQSASASKAVRWSNLKIFQRATPATALHGPSEPRRVNPLSCRPSSHDYRVCDGFYTRVRGLTAEMLSQRLSVNERPKYGRKAQALMIRVRMFFDELKALLGPSCKGTMFDCPTSLTAAACGVSRSTVLRIGNNLQVLNNLQKERKKNNDRRRSRKEERLAVMKNYGKTWGEPIRQIIRHKLKTKADARLDTLHHELTYTVKGFTLSKTTLYRLIRGLGFRYKLQNGKKSICEEEEPLETQEPIGEMESSSDSDGGLDDSDAVECEYHELMEEDVPDEPWMLESMDKNKDGEVAPCYVFRPAKSTASNLEGDEITGD